MKYSALAAVALLAAGLSGCGHMDYVAAAPQYGYAYAPSATPAAPAQGQPYTAYVNGRWVTVYPNATTPTQSLSGPPTTVIVTVPAFCPSYRTAILFGVYTPGCPMPYYYPYGGSIVIQGRIRIGGGHHRR